jgi:predicted phosphodiesterase
MKEKIYVLGDIHGAYNTITWWVNKFDIKNSIIIQLGDFGIGFKSNKEAEHRPLIALNVILSENSVHLYVIRGNHDDPECFTSDEFNKSNITFLPDYSVLELEGTKILLVGGAISIDRSVRKQDVPPSWFPGEVFVLNEEKLSEYRNIDVVITHTAPSFCYPVGWNQLVYDWADVDPGLHHELPEERKKLTKMWDILNKNNKIKKYFYGHFHSSKKEIHEGTEFILLGIGEFHELIINDSL